MNCDLIFQRCSFFLPSQPYSCTSHWHTENIHKQNKCLRNAFSPNWGDRVFPALMGLDQKIIFSKQEIFLSYKICWDFLSLFCLGTKQKAFEAWHGNRRQSNKWFCHSGLVTGIFMLGVGDPGQSQTCYSLESHMLLPVPDFYLCFYASTPLKLIPFTVSRSGQLNSWKLIFFFLVELGLCVYCLTTEWAQSECQQSRGARRADGCQDHGNATLDNFSLLWNGRPGEVPTPPNLKHEVGIQRQCTFFSHCNNKQFDPEPLRVFPQLPKSVQTHDDKLVLSPKSLYFILKFLV